MVCFFHKFLRSDEDRALHNHPWDFIVIPVWRGYYEHNLKGKKRVWPFISARFRKKEYVHRVELINEKPAYSIFIRFRREQIWGFLIDGKIQKFNEWWKENC